MSTDNNFPKVHPHVKIIREVIPENAPTPAVHHDRFHHVSQAISAKLGSPTAFASATLLVIVWALTGPIFNFSNTWQLAINTTTTIVTFLMVFAIQNAQNRDSRSMQLKLDELINSNHGARTEFVDVEDLTDAELETLHDQFKDLHEKFNNRRLSK